MSWFRRQRYERLVPTARVVVEVYVPGLTPGEVRDLTRRVNEAWRDWHLAHHDGRWHMVNTKASIRDDLLEGKR